MNENGVQKGLSKLKSGKLLEILFILIIIVIVAIVLYNFLSRDRTEKNGSSDYGEALARELEETLSAIQGAGEVTVMISFSSDGETVIAMETITEEDGTIVTTPVFVGGEVVVLEEKNPEISGVLIVAEGAEDLSVRFDLLSAAASVLDIDQSLIKVYARG